MKIYVGHSSNFDYKSELYEPLRSSVLNTEHEISLPHELSDQPSNSIEKMKTMDMMLAEVSYPSTGLGIELGWANILGIHILSVHKIDMKPSRSIHTVCDAIYGYQDSQDLLKIVREHINEISFA